MVKFGRHIDVFDQGITGSGLFVVPYNDVKSIFHDEILDKNARREKFEQKWRENLEGASRNFQEATIELWKKIFDVITSSDESRGVLPAVAFGLYAEKAGTEATQEIFSRLKLIHGAAYANSEALRKLVKKFDKNCCESHQEERLSPSLLPLLYVANFFVGLSTLEEGLALLRTLLGDDDYELDADDRNDIDKSHHDQIVGGRQAEFDWLKRLTQALSHDELSRLVAHRGFHSAKDHSHLRPVENSLTAYESAWTCGIHLCECDVALTKDERLVLAHDENLSRLALDRDSPTSSMKISDLTFKELISLPLTSCSRAPLLIDVLRSAHAIGDNAQLIIEIKPGNEAAAEAIANMLLRHPDLMPTVAMIMSFDAYTMHKLRQELFSPGIQQENRPLGHVRNNSLSFLFPAGTDEVTNSLPGHQRLRSGSLGGPHIRSGSIDYFGTGMTLGEASRKASQLMGETGADGTSAYPKLMLLTVADPPKRPCELRVSVDDLSPIESWMNSGQGSLDGVYLQFEKAMLGPPGAAALRNLAEKYKVGVWTYADIGPDDYETFHKLVRDSNVRFVNTDLPPSFRRDIKRKSSTVSSKHGK